MTNTLSPVLKELIDQINNSSISTIKSVVKRIIQIINDPESTARDLEEVIEVDPPLTARVLKVANSAYYSPQNKIREIDEAVIWLGFNTVKELVLSQKVCEIFEKDVRIGNYSRPALWRHSFAVALLSKMIYRREFGERGENAYVAGILHDIGIIALDQFKQEEFKECLSRALNEKRNLHSIETDVMGFNHAVVGKALVESWNLPKEYAETVGGHHNYIDPDKEHYRIASTIAIANQYCQMKNIGYNDAPFTDHAQYKSSLENLGLSQSSLELIAKAMQTELAKMEEMGIF